MTLDISSNLVRTGSDAETLRQDDVFSSDGSEAVSFQNVFQEQVDRTQEVDSREIEDAPREESTMASWNLAAFQLQAAGLQPQQVPTSSPIATDMSLEGVSLGIHSVAQDDRGLAQSGSGFAPIDKGITQVDVQAVPTEMHLFSAQPSEGLRSIAKLGMTSESPRATNVPRMTGTPMMEPHQNEKRDVLNNSALIPENSPALNEQSSAQNATNVSDKNTDFSNRQEDEKQTLEMTFAQEMNAMQWGGGIAIPTAMQPVIQQEFKQDMPARSSNRMKEMETGQSLKKQKDGNALFQENASVKHDTDKSFSPVADSVSAVKKDADSSHITNQKGYPAPVPVESRFAAIHHAAMAEASNTKEANTMVQPMMASLPSKDLNSTLQSNEMSEMPSNVSFGHFAGHPQTGNNPVGAVSSVPNDDWRQALEQRQENAANAVNHMTLRREVHTEVDVPDLGKIVVNARVEAGEVDLRIAATQQQTVGLLQSKQSEMQASLQSAHIPLSHFSVGSSLEDRSNASTYSSSQGSADSRQFGQSEQGGSRREAASESEHQRTRRLSRRVRIVL